MKQGQWNKWFTLAALAGLAWASQGLAEEKPSGKDSKAARPKLYGFCVETHDAKKRTLPEQAQMLRELGFDGVGYPFWLDASLEKNLKILDEAGLPVYLFHARINVNPKAPAFDPKLPAAISRLKGRPVTVSVLLAGLRPGDPQGMDQAVKALRELGDVAARAGTRISIYHHTGDWTESLLFALKVINQVNHPQVGVNFNLCHWLMIDGDKDYRPVLRENASKIFAVTLNGAQKGTKTWTNGLIQPLDQGDFDNQELLKVLQEAGYRGPIGLMCYGIPGDAREHLERSLKLWKSWQGSKP